MTRILLAVIVAALSLASAIPAAAQIAQELPTFHIAVRDGRFDPSRVEVPTGKRIKFILRNEGPGPLEFENDEMRIEKVLGPGATSFVVLPKLAPGTYTFVDEFNPITGELTVVAE